MGTKTKVVEASPAEIAKQIADKAAGEIASLEAKLTSLQGQDTQLRQEREQIVHDQAQRADNLLSLQHRVVTQEQAHKDAVAYASVAQGTLGEQEAVKQVNARRQALESAHADVENVAGPYSEQDQAATSCLAEIDAELQRMQHEAQQAHARKMDVERVRDRAVSELGEHTYAGLLEEYQAHQAKIEAARQQLVELQVEKVQFLGQAKETLLPWPVLAHKFKSEEPYDDPTARILTAARDYVERLVEDGPQITRSMNVPAANHANGNTWLALLEVPRDDLFVNEYVSLGKRNRGLSRRLNVLNELLSQYVAWKR